MSEIENKTSNEADEEISLIDLFSVLIRHRIMIILGTILVFVIAAGYLFVYPMLFPKAMQREITVKYSISVTPVPGTLVSELPSRYSNLKNIITSEFSDPVFLVGELSKNNPFVNKDSKEMSAFDFNMFVQSLLSDKKIQISQASIRDEVIVVMKLPEENLDVATRLVDSMVASVNDSVETVFLREVNKVIKSKKETYEEIQKTFKENSNITDAQTLMLTVRQINEFLDTYKFISKREMEPFVVREPLGRIKKLAVVTFAAFFIFIFLAFLINAVENIKQDPEASSKIKAAWDGGKIGKK